LGGTVLNPRRPVRTFLGEQRNLRSDGRAPWNVCRTGALPGHSARTVLFVEDDPQEHVDVLFSDVVMPGMSGIDLAEKTRRLRPHLQIMSATGYSARAPEAAHLGKLFIKPLRARQIDAELRELMSVQ
jgi:DNA-binding LytR/AlgR family response regulator